MSVREWLVRCGGATVPRNVREPSEELLTPSADRDVHSPIASPPQGRPINRDVS
jgi:hypothetical protein